MSSPKKLLPRGSSSLPDKVNAIRITLANLSWRSCVPRHRSPHDQSAPLAFTLTPSSMSAAVALISSKRGEPHGSAPPTPPYVRVRTRRFGGLSGPLGATREARPSEAKKALGSAMVSAGLLLSRQGPCGLPAVCAARSRPTPRRRSSAKRVRPALPLLPGDGAQPSPDPLVEVAQHRRGLAEAEVAAPADEVDATAP